MTKRIRKIALILAISLNIAGCTNANNIDNKDYINTEKVQDNTENTKNIQANSVFMYHFTEVENFYKMNRIEKAIYLSDSLNENNDSNILFSTVHINNILKLLYDNADKSQKESIDKFTGDYKANTYDNLLFESLWVNPSLDVKPTLENIDVSNDYKELTKEINEWIYEKSDKQVKNFTLNNDLDTESSMFVGVTNVDVVLNWDLQSRGMKFNNSDGKTLYIDSLNTINTFDYHSSMTANAFSFEYKPNIKIMFILPKDKNKDFSFCNLWIEDLLNNKNKKTLDIKIPKFKLSQINYDVLEHLNSLGINFISDVDLGNNAKIDKVVQKGILSTSEIPNNKLETEKTTDTQIKDKKIKKMRFNRPFAIMLYNSEDNEIISLYKISEFSDN